jgi:hypothetical protein
VGNVLTHLYDVLDPDRIVAAADPAIAPYQAYAAWVCAQLSTN